MFCVSRLRRLVAVVVMACALGGCSIFASEFRNRGGLSDYLLDQYWFRADTKQMRALRSYALIGSLLKISVRNHTARETRALAEHVNLAIQQAESAVNCAYAEPPYICVFFDERMAELDRSLLRIALNVLTSEENEDLFEKLRDAMFGKTLPLESINTAAKVLDAGADTINLAAKTARIASGLLKIGGKALEYGQRLGPIYRDTIELDMIVVLASLRRISEQQRLTPTAPTLTGAGLAHVREVHADGLRIYLNGAGNFRRWRTYLSDNIAAGYFTSYIIPEAIHFAQVSELIWRACADLIDNTNKALLATCRSYGSSDTSKNRLLYGEQVAELFKSTQDRAILKRLAKEGEETRGRIHLQ